jgi:8-oxo-dGTP pyrophosphatase MutT (NUDIX family)
LIYVEIRNRRASRLLVIDRRHRVLLLQYEDDGGKWWATPGGGVQDGESFESAARREAREELGLTGFPIEPLWQAVNEFEFRGVHQRQTENFFLIRANGSDIIVDRDVAIEHAIEGIVAIRWWSCSELRLTNERVFPVDLPTRIESVLLQRG